MAPSESGIVVVDSTLAPDELKRLVERWFGDMVKFVVDVDRACATVGGELHADGEAELLERGSRQESLWGANYYPGRGEANCIEYTALINIRPTQRNFGMTIADPIVRDRVRDLAHRLIGRGEPLA